MPEPPFDPWTSADPLGEALHFLRLSGVFYSRSECTAPWGLAVPPFPGCMMFHVVTEGACWLDVGADEPPRHLHGGDLALVPHGDGHRLASAPEAPTLDLFAVPRRLVGDRYEVLTHGGGGEAAVVICGVVRTDHPAARQLIDLLPRLLVVEAGDPAESEWVKSTVRFLTIEAATLRAGGETVITRLADILVVQAIRAWLARHPAGQMGWLAALRDPQIGQAVALIHRDPTGHRTLPALARAVGMSRSSFAARFSMLVGEPVMRYATRWRMYAARMWLAREHVTVAQAAERLGYESEAAFSRAFKRVLGTAPGEVRRGERPLDE